MAAKNGHRDMCELLVANGADVNARNVISDSMHWDALLLVPRSSRRLLASTPLLLWGFKRNHIRLRQHTADTAPYSQTRKPHHSPRTLIREAVSMLTHAPLVPLDPRTLHARIALALGAGSSKPNLTCTHLMGPQTLDLDLKPSFCSFNLQPPIFSPQPEAPHRDPDADTVIVGS